VRWRPDSSLPGVVDRAPTTRRTADLDVFGAELRQRWGGYGQLGKVFAEIVGNP
jgi:hypothetical protein